MERFVVLGTLDTKGPEILFAKDLILQKGYRPLVIDCGMLGEPLFAPDITREELAIAAGTDLAGLRAAPKNDAILTMQKGIEIVVGRLYADGHIAGILSLGGGQGTVMATAIMQSLPFGFPKVMVSTVANGQQAFGPFMGHKDIAIIHSVADILGLNTITRTVIAKGVGAMFGMAEIAGTFLQESKPAIAITSAGVTTPCVMRIREILESKGYEVIAFHCNGIGARAMEELAAEGNIRGIIDLSPHDIADKLYNGIFPADDHRLELPCAHAVPIVFVPGGLDFILFGAIDKMPPPMLKRRYVKHNPLHTHVRANFGEMERMGLEVTAKLVANAAPVSILVPTRGFTQLNKEGTSMYEPESDPGFVAGVRAVLAKSPGNHIKLKEFPYHINDPQFAGLVAEEMDWLLSEENCHA